MAIFLAPHTKASVAKIKMDSILKEVTVMDRDAYTPTINWNVFFGEVDGQLHPNIAPNPRMATEVNMALHTWLTRQIQSSPRLPSISNKLVPSFTRMEMSAYIDLLLQPPEVATQGSLEYLESRYGISFTGSVEMSQRWYTNQIGPRTYYISGATTYGGAKYTKDIWNDLVDSLVVTQRRNRVNPRRIHVDIGKDAIFYDLTSFTSNMATQRVFLERLAQWCHGTEVEILDVCCGVTRVDLGDLVQDYNRTCNWFPSYRNDRLFDEMTDRIHGVAGFLGVIGNIATCTFLHGAVLLQLATEVDECGCAGDDAVIVIEEEDRVWGCVSLLGIVAQEKTFRLSDGPVVYLKRRTFLHETKYTSRLNQSDYLQLPSFLWLIGGETLRTSYPYFRECHSTAQELLELACNSLTATFRSGAKFRSHPSFPEMFRFIEAYYLAHKFPITGFVPQYSRKSPYGFLPALATFGSRSFIHDTLTDLYPGFAWLPIRDPLRDDLVPVKEGIIFRSTGGREVAILRKMGVVKPIKMEHTLYAGQEGLDAILREYSSPSPKVVTYRVMTTWDTVFGSGTITGELFSEYANVLSCEDK